MAAARDLEYLRPHCATDRQEEVLDAIIEHGSYRSAAKALGLAYGAIADKVGAMKKRAAMAGEGEHFQAHESLPNPLTLKGTTTLYKDGVQQLQWVKSTVDADQREALVRAALEGLCSEIKPVKPTPAPNYCDEDLLTVYPQGDPHAGLYSWKQETGEHFDLAEYERTACIAVDRLVQSSPNSAIALFNDKGDTTHADNGSNRTPKSGNPLDVHGRHTEVVGINFKVKRYQVARMLEKHRKVIIRIDPGNHDPETARLITGMMAALYENEPRVEVVESPKHYWYYLHGKCLVGTTHGDGAKGQDLPLLMATDVPQLWGQSWFRLWFVGHLHHRFVKEYPGCTVEYLRTLAATDAWHHASGYRSLRDMMAITLHKEFGEVERHTCSMAMIGEPA